MDAKEFETRLSAALREQPPGTAALLGDFAMAVLHNNSITFQYVVDPYSGVLGDEFTLTDDLWMERHEQLADWFNEPEFAEAITVRGDSMNG
jgi:hypothetical protein